MDAEELITFSVPRAVLTNISSLPRDLLEAMHELLEKNAGGKLGAIETAELRTLVRMAEFSQIVAMTLQSSAQERL